MNAVLFLIAAFVSPTLADTTSTVRLVPWGEHVAELIDNRGYELRQCFKGAPRSSTDAYRFDLVLNEDGTVSTIRFRRPTDDQVESALTCVSDKVIGMRFPAFEGGTRGIEFVLRPMSTMQTELRH